MTDGGPGAAGSGTSAPRPVAWGPDDRRGGRWRWAWGSGPWLVFLAPLVADTIKSDHEALLRALTVLDLVAFAAVYVLAVPLVVVRPLRDPARLLAPLLLLLLGLLAVPIGGEAALGTFVFVCVIAVALLPTRPAFLFVGATAGLAVVLIMTVPGWSRDPAGLIFSILLATLATYGFVRLIRRNAELAEAREELAQAAVSEERARFARDLHDLLGHSLTVITVKSDLAKRLVHTDPDRAVREITDVERLSREALADVRATVTGYRGVSLASEVASARAVLEAAGMQADLPGALDEVPGNRRELFAWVVREGVTNAVRHSGAASVRVAVTSTSVEVVDDGRGAVDREEVTGAGHGLTGLRERVTAAGGRLDAGPGPGGGFRLRAEVPA